MSDSAKRLLFIFLQNWANFMVFSSIFRYYHLIFLKRRLKLAGSTLFASIWLISGIVFLNLRKITFLIPGGCFNYGDFLRISPKTGFLTFFSEVFMDRNILIYLTSIFLSKLSPLCLIMYYHLNHCII